MQKAASIQPRTGLSKFAKNYQHVRIEVSINLGALEEFGDMGSASAFGQYFPDVFVNACVARFQDEDWRVRSTAAVTVARLGPPEAAKLAKLAFFL